MDRPSPLVPRPRFDRSRWVRPVRRDPTGRTGPTKRQASGPGWRRTSHGFYVPACVDPRPPEQRILEASAVAPEGYGVTGWAALRWWTGGRWFDGLGADGSPTPVPLAGATRRARAQAGITICGERVLSGDLTELDGVPLLVPVAAASFAARFAADLRDAVVVWDMAAYYDLVSLGEARDHLASQAGWTGIDQARRAVGLADENSWSPMETRTRLRWVLDAALPLPLTNAPIFDRSGRHLATGDLVDPTVGLVAEYDGADHRGRRLADVRREDVLRDLGLEYVTSLAGDGLGPHAFVERLRRAHRRASLRIPTEPVPRWTLTAPRGWTSTDTVAARRGLGPGERARLLRYRT